MPCDFLAVNNSVRLHGIYTNVTHKQNRRTENQNSDKLETYTLAFA